MRMCGHAHHDDMLYLGKEPQPAWDYPTLHAPGYADAGSVCLLVGARSHPGLCRPSAAEGVIDEEELDRLKAECEKLVDARGTGGDRRIVAARRSGWRRGARR